MHNNTTAFLAQIEFSWRPDVAQPTVLYSTDANKRSQLHSLNEMLDWNQCILKQDTLKGYMDEPNLSLDQMYTIRLTGSPKSSAVQ